MPDLMTALSFTRISDIFIPRHANCMASNNIFWNALPDQCRMATSCLLMPRGPHVVPHDLLFPPFPDNSSLVSVSKRNKSIGISAKRNLRDCRRNATVQSPPSLSWRLADPYGQSDGDCCSKTQSSRGRYVCPGIPRAFTQTPSHWKSG